MNSTDYSFYAIIKTKLYTLLLGICKSSLKNHRLQISWKFRIKGYVRITKQDSIGNVEGRRRIMYQNMKQSSNNQGL